MPANLSGNIRQQIEQVTNAQVKSASPLSGGMIGDVYVVNLSDERKLVAKVDKSPDSTLALEGDMLRCLRENSQIPVPDVLHNANDLLLMSHVQGESQFSAAAQRHAADLLAALHSVTAPHYGHHQDTLIGGLHQPNPQTDQWIPFFKEHRLLYMAHVAHDAGRLPSDTLQRIEHLASRLDQHLTEPEAPALIHGDVWTTNVLANNNHITAFLDPAIYYAHPEIELAFITLFNTFGQPFFDRYQQHHPIQPDFFERRRDLYNLYPLLVHVRLFGGYIRRVQSILGQFGV